MNCQEVVSHPDEVKCTDGELWHKMGYRVVDKSTESELVAQIVFYDINGCPLRGIKPGHMYSIDNTTENLVIFSRNVLLLEAMCRFLNSGGTYTDLDLLSSAIYHRTPIIQLYDYEVIGVSANVEYETVLKTPDSDYIRVVDGDFSERLDSLAVLDIRSDANRLALAEYMLGA